VAVGFSRLAKRAPEASLVIIHVDWVVVTTNLRKLLKIVGFYIYRKVKPEVKSERSEKDT
jgi:hypothetical protein